MTGAPLDEVRVARITLAHLAEPGRRDLGVLVRSVGPVEALDRLRCGAVPGSLREATAARMSLVDPVRRAGRAVEQAARCGARIIVPEDEEWPACLDDLAAISLNDSDAVDRDTDPPHAIWLRGPGRLHEA